MTERPQESSRTPIIWSVTTRLAAILLLVFSVRGLAYGAADLVHDVRSNSGWWVDLAFTLVFSLLFGLAFFGLLLWMAWRLWFRLNVTTLRWAVGIVLAIGLFSIVLRILPASQQPGNSPLANITAVIAIVVAAMLYRRIISAVIRSSKLDDPLDIYGQPRGHQGRVKFFATVLGWSIWMAGESIDRIGHSSNRPDSVAAILGFLGPAVAGWAVYKIVMWRMMPRTKPPVPLGGFEVVTNSASAANVLELNQQPACDTGTTRSI